MKKVSEEAKAEFVKDVDNAVSKCAIEMSFALTKMLIKAYPEKAETIKTYALEHQKETIATFKEELIGDGCNFEETIGMIAEVVNKLEIKK